MSRINLKKFRIDMNLKSKDMARMLKISSAYYSNLEAGRVNPSYELLEEFEKIFGVDEKEVWWLFKKS